MVSSILYPGGTSKAIEPGYIPVYLIRFFQGEMTNASGRTVRVNKTVSIKSLVLLTGEKPKLSKGKMYSIPPQTSLKMEQSA
jgi:hypothetical protein